MSYIAEIESRVAGIPCIIGVTYFDSEEGSYSYHADSDVDYYGYTECEFDVLDRRGRKAAWLERKLTAKDTDRIESEIAEYLNDF
jgi:hypothetical protein